MAKRIARPRPKVTVATTSPTVTDDASKGNQYFSRWYNSVTGKLFTCVDPAVEAAIWKEEAAGGGGVHVDTVDPTNTDDGTKGFGVGDLWYNSVTTTLWECKDNSTDAAVWKAQSNLAHFEYLVGEAKYARFQTIQAAIDQAVADGHGFADPVIVYVLEGTYVENVTLYPGISLEAVNEVHAHGSYPLVGLPFIQGTLTYAAGFEGGTIYVRRMKVNPTTGIVVTISGTAVKTLLFDDCHIQSEDDVVFQHIGSNWCILNVRTSYVTTNSATHPVMILAAQVQLSVIDSIASIGSLTGDVVQLTGGRFLYYGSGGNGSDSIGGVVNVASGAGNVVQLRGVVMLNGAAADVVVTGSLDTNNSFFQNCWHRNISPEDRSPITISGPNASQLRESPQTASPGDMWRYDGSQFKLSNEIERGVLAQAAPMGFPNIVDTGIDWNDGTKTFTLSKTGADFDVWVKGVRYNFVADQVLVGDGTDFTIAEGMWFFYFDATGTLVASQTIWDFSQGAPVVIIYWDAAASTAIIFCDERHGLAMDWATHKYLHETEGTGFKNGLNLTVTVDGDGDSDVHVQAALSNGEIQDEDLFVPIVNGVGGGRFEQDLDPTAKIPVYYRDGATGVWRKKTADTFPVYQGSLYAATRCGWNDSNAGGVGIWGITEVVNNRFTETIICATNNYHEPIIAILGQADYSSLLNARNTDPLLTMDLTGLPVEEIRYLYRLILQVNNLYANTVKARWRSPVTDYRTASLGAPASATLPTDHQALSNRDAVGAHPAAAVEPDTTNFDGILSSADDTVQKALETLDSQLFTMTFTFQNNGAVLNTGVQDAAYFQVPCDCEIKNVRMYGGPSGSIVVDLWKDTYAAYPPDDADSITASTPPTISGGVKSEDTTLTGWTKELTAGEGILPNIDSVTNMTWVKIVLMVAKIKQVGG